MVALTVASTVHQQQQASQQVDWANKAAEDAFQANLVQANAARVEESKVVQLRQQQETSASEQEARERARQEREDLASTNVAAGEAGVTGFSVESILRDISGMAATDLQTIETNRENRLGQLDTELAGIRTNSINRVNSLGRGTAASPSNWGAGLQIASSAAGAYSKYKTANPSAPKTTGTTQYKPNSMIQIR
jgi:hypothetical protein